MPLYGIKIAALPLRIEKVLSFPGKPEATYLTGFTPVKQKQKMVSLDGPDLKDHLPRPEAGANSASASDVRLIATMPACPP